MPFVYIHVALFSVWMLFIESDPWPTLTLIVSLEAIFLSTFVMIGQNRQSAFLQAKADHDFQRTRARTQDQHRPDSRDPYTHHRTVPAAPRGAHPVARLQPSRRQSPDLSALARQDAAERPHMPLSAPTNVGASRAERPVGGVALRMGYEVDMAVLRALYPARSLGPLRRLGPAADLAG